MRPWATRRRSAAGQEWNDSTNAWQSVNWQTAGYWASLRAAAPLAQDDGLNFLRLDHPAPFQFQYWEVGNEEYGSWEIDHHTVQHDPATYIAFAKQFADLAATIDPSISIGLDVQSPGIDFNNWTADILQQSASQGLHVGFLSDHNYVQAPGSESDSNLLLDTVTGTNSDPSDPGDPYDWAARAAGYESLLTKYLGAAASKVQLLATEFNSVYSEPRQADDEPRQRPVPGRLAGRHARDALQRGRRLGPAEFVLDRRQRLIEPLRLAHGRRLRLDRQPRRNGPGDAARTCRTRRILPRSSPRRSFRPAAMWFRPRAATRT